MYTILEFLSMTIQQMKETKPKKRKTQFLLRFSPVECMNARLFCLFVFEGAQQCYGIIIVVGSAKIINEPCIIYDRTSLHK